MKTTTAPTAEIATAASTDIVLPAGTTTVEVTDGKTTIVAATPVAEKPKRVRTKKAPEAAKPEAKAPKAKKEKVVAVKVPKTGKFDIFGHSATSVIRALGKLHVPFKVVRKALEVKLGAEHVPSTNTIRAFLSAGHLGQRGTPAPLTAEQLEELKQAGAAAVMGDAIAPSVPAVEAPESAPAPTAPAVDKNARKEMLKAALKKVDAKLADPAHIAIK